MYSPIAKLEEKSSEAPRENIQVNEVTENPEKL